MIEFNPIRRPDRFWRFLGKDPEGNFVYVRADRDSLQSSFDLYVGVGTKLGRIPLEREVATKEPHGSVWLTTRNHQHVRLYYEEPFYPGDDMSWWQRLRYNAKIWPLRSRFDGLRLRRLNLYDYVILDTGGDEVTIAERNPIGR